MSAFGPEGLWNWRTWSRFDEWDWEHEKHFPESRINLQDLSRHVRSIQWK